MITGEVTPPAPGDVEKTCRNAAIAMGEKVKNAQIAFFGGSFTAIDRDYMISLLEPAQNAVREYGFSGIRCSTRPDAVDDYILDIMEKYGVNAIELGAQSMDDQVLALNRRGHTAAQTEMAAERIKARGIELGLQMMTGLLGDTDEKAMNTAERIISLHPETARIYPAVVLEGTELADRYLSGEYRPQTIDEAVELCAAILPRLENADIRVIRVGLHAGEDVERQKLAGPYHPAFRQLVQSRVFLKELISALAPQGSGKYLVRVNPKTISVALGQKRNNVTHLENMGYRAAFLQDEQVKSGSFLIESIE